MYTQRRKLYIGLSRQFSRCLTALTYERKEMFYDYSIPSTDKLLLNRDLDIVYALCEKQLPKEQVNSENILECIWMLRFAMSLMECIRNMIHHRRKCFCKTPYGDYYDH